ncbi:MAG TPA: flagellar biosynthesis anti-sigma factor FlgM [Syntrophorhabdus sp.]|jgi:negative regulator of flagellin synthesis FlgM|nr:flagellar biosynthesis anti-sigma factor FlgM [Syntrophorhabdus sp.]HNS77174.1 flagellar biosynthesis anti-sigma factor FlgM [Syntrophorhabdus sp.]HNY69571.1 flagellar biosynthesis anti-sigma factor FlgM [Syntrophorhabdus sp.]
MKINNEVKNSLLESLTKSKNVRASQEMDVQKGQGGGVADKVELSGKRDEINRIKERIKAEPVVRQEKVDSIRDAIETKTYNIKGQLVAKSILKNHLLDQVL